VSWVAVGLGVMAASTVVSTAAAYNQSRTAKKVAQRNASIAEMQAQDAERRGEEDATKARQKGSTLIGLQRAAFASRGLELQAGTPADLIDQSEFFSIKDQTTARNNAAREAWAARAQAGGFQAEADSQNPNAAAFATFLGGASSVASKWYSYGGGGTKKTPDAAKGNDAFWYD
jgi:hypothetical protein